MEISKTVNIIISILVIAGAAVNSGGFYYYLAIPFMIYLIYTGYKYKKIFAVFGIVYSLCAITISTTRDNNPFLYPILNDGKIKILIQNGILTDIPLEKYKVTTYDEFKDAFNVDKSPALNSFLNDPTMTHGEFNLTFNNGGSIGTQKITKVKYGDTINVTGISHDYAALQDNIILHTNYGSFDQYYLLTSKKYHPTKELQSGWSNKLEAFSSPGILLFYYIGLYALLFIWKRRSKISNFVDEN